MPPADARYPEFIEAFDASGRSIKIAREGWRTSVLLGAFQRAYNDPQELNSVIRHAIKDGFFADSVEPARRLLEISPAQDKPDAAAILSEVLRQTGELREAERVLLDAVLSNGKSPVLLCNLGLVYGDQGKIEQAERFYWEALELDPNFYNAPLLFLLKPHPDASGADARNSILERAASIPGSWRPLIWQAHEKLQAGDVEAAIGFFRELIRRVKPLPTDVLEQMSGDLGKAGHLRELVELCAPLYEPKSHRTMVGNNLIMAYMGLDQVEEARRVLERIYALERTDLGPFLSYWETEIGKRETNRRSIDPAVAKVTLLTIEVPLWARTEPVFAPFLPAKLQESPLIAFVCGSVTTGTSEYGAPTTTAADVAGQYSRAIPLYLAEQVYLRTTARVKLLCPYVEEEGYFVVLSATSPARAYFDFERKARYFVLVDLNIREEPGTLHVSLRRSTDEKVLLEWSGPYDAQDLEKTIGPALKELVQEVLALEDVFVPTTPNPFFAPAGTSFTSYASGAQKALAIRIARIAAAKGRNLVAERNIIEGLLNLVGREPQNLCARLMLMSTLEDEAIRRSDIGRHFLSRVEAANRQWPLPEAEQKMVDYFMARIRQATAQPALEI